MKIAFAVAACLLVAAGLWFLLGFETVVHHDPAGPTTPIEGAGSNRPADRGERPQAAVEFKAQAPASISNAVAATTAVVAPLPPDLAALPEATVLQNLSAVIHNFGATFDGNPVGTNQEITRALQGDNPKHINFLKADGNRVNGNGELVDIWGTPYFFHQLSGRVMEIRSAGPDRRMWTEDDLVTR